MTNPGADAFTLSRQFIAPTNLPSAPSLTDDLVAGLLLTWDPTSLANTVLLGGAVLLTNLLTLNPTGLSEGTVLLAKTASSYIILGNLGSSRTVDFIPALRYRSLRDDILASSTSLIDAGILNFLLNSNTQYGLDGVFFYNANGTASIKFAWTGPPNMACKWNTYGDVASGTDDFPIFNTETSYGDATTQTIFGFGASAVAHPKAWFATSDTGGLLQVRFAQNASNVTPSVLQSGSWLRCVELGPSSGVQTQVKTYECTGSRSYDGDGIFIGSPDGDNNMYTWTPPGRHNGSERHMWTFDATALRADVAGGAVLSAQMFLYCFDATSFPADYNWKWSHTATIQTTWPDNGFGGLDVKNVWYQNAWAGIDITSEIVNVISSDANSILGGSYNFTDSATAFRGYGFSADYRPYIQLLISS